MELSELRQRLEGFCAAHYSGPTEITEVVVMPGHAVMISDCLVGGVRRADQAISRHRSPKDCPATAEIAQ